LRQPKLHFLDTETTGVTPKHVIIQIAGIIDIGYKNKVHEYDMTMAPFKTDPISEEALKINGRTREEIAAFRDKRVVHSEFCGMMGKHVGKFDKTDKFFMVGYNTSFDHGKMGQWFDACGDKYLMSWFHFPIIDVAQLAGIYLMEERDNILKFKLKDVALYLEVIYEDGDGNVRRMEDDSIINLHDALSDIVITRDMFYFLRGKMMRMEGEL